MAISIKKKCIGFLLIAAVILPVFHNPVYAKTTAEKIQEAEAQKQQTEALKKQAEALKEQTEDKKENLEDTKEELEGYLGELNTSLTEVSERLSELETQIEDKNAEIKKTQTELAEAKQQEADQYELMKCRIKFMYEKGETSYIEAFLTANTYSDFLNKADYVAKVEEYDQKMLQMLIALKEEITAKEEQLQNEMNDLEALEKQVTEEKEKVTEMVDSTSGSLASTSGQLVAAEAEAAAYEAEIANKEAELAAQEANLKALKKQLAEEQAMSRKAANMAWRDVSELTFEPTDRDLLACLIYCEAGNQPYEGQVAVGAVVINRMRSAAFPNTMVGVIYAPRQFSPVGSGRLAARLAMGATPACYSAADDAMKGSTPVGNCLYFRTPIPEVSGQIIGGHVFY
ncbi:MAG TPA: cell wall hydrolase [Lachnospiraceae bacterium]|jgi:spore germination cell wall hydrolase CwlJ-like protein|nr:cell wall hydrolase [Lachnospiraceae bacterium]